MLLLALACTSSEPVLDDTSATDTACSRQTWYADADDDGVGGDEAQEACEAPFGHVATTGDCDDHDRAVSPEAPEVCDAKDNDCDGEVDEGLLQPFYLDADGDGFGGEETLACEAPFDHVEQGGDCDDGSSLVHPGAVEYCDEVDNDCDGDVDEGALGQFSPDEDGDGFGDVGGAVVEACAAPSGYGEASDCDDGDAAIHPDADELCGGGQDEDCDGLVDCEDAECDGQEGCQEGDCTDGVDNELDGLTDCEDDECWVEPTCIDSVATVVTGGNYFAFDYVNGGSGYHSFSASALTGRLLLYGAFGTASCTWGTSSSTFNGYASGQVFATYGQPARVVSSACPASAVPFPTVLSVGSSGEVLHSQGVFLRPHSSAWRYTSVSSGAQYRYVIGPLTTGDPWTP